MRKNLSRQTVSLDPLKERSVKVNYRNRKTGKRFIAFFLSLAMVMTFSFTSLAGTVMAEESSDPVVADDSSVTAEQQAQDQKKYRESLYYPFSHFTASFFSFHSFF